MTLKNILITGGSRGIGLAIARRLARQPCRLILAAKTVDPHPKLPGTLATAAKEIQESERTHRQTDVVTVQLDLRDPAQIQKVVEETIQKSDTGRLDALVNNASTISTRKTGDLDLKKYQLMQDINVRGTFLMTQACLPFLLQSRKKNFHPQVLTLSPPVDLDYPEWFKLGGTAYTASKYTMSMYTMGWAKEFYGQIGFNALWPKTVIDTAATRMLLGEQGQTRCRSSEIMAEAANIVLNEHRKYTGNLLIDEDLLREYHVDVEQYNLGSKNPLPDLFVGRPRGFKWQFGWFRLGKWFR